METFKRGVGGMLALLLTLGGPGLEPCRAAAAAIAPAQSARAPLGGANAGTAGRVQAPLPLSMQLSGAASLSLVPSAAAVFESAPAPLSAALPAPASLMPVSRMAAPARADEPALSAEPGGTLETLERGAAEAIQEQTAGIAAGDPEAGVLAVDRLYQGTRRREGEREVSGPVVAVDASLVQPHAAGLAKAGASALDIATPPSEISAGPAPSSIRDGSWFPSRYYRRYAAWWLQPAASVSAGSWLHGALVGAGYAADVSLGGGLASALWSALIFGVGSSAVFAAPRLVVSAWLGRSAAFPRVDARAAAAAFGVAALYGLALAVPMGAGIPSMLLTGGALAALLAWIIVGAVAGRRDTTSSVRPGDRYRLIAHALAVAAPLAVAGDVFGIASLSTLWLGTFALAATLFLDGVFSAVRAAIRWIARRVRSGVPVPADQKRRGFLSGVSAAGVLGLGGGVGAAAAAAFGPDWNRKIGHYRPDEELFYRYRYDDAPERGEPTAVSLDESWRRFEQSLAALRRDGLSEREAVEAALIVNKSVTIFTGSRYDRGRYGDASLKDSLSSERFRRLEAFLLDPQVVRAPSVAARELVVDAKRSALSLLFSSARDRKASVRPLVARLSPLARYEEKIVFPDPAYPAFGFTETEHLSLAVRSSFFRAAYHEDALPVLDSIGIGEDERERVHKRYEGIRSVLGRWFLGETLGAERELLLRVSEARAARLHPIPIAAVDMVRSLRSWPRVVRTALAESADAHGMPPELLFSNFARQIERHYTLADGLSIFADRQDKATSSGLLKAKVGRWLSKRVPQDVRMPVHWNDFLGGVVLSGKNGIGLFQIRPANVRSYPWVWRRFGVSDAGALSDREISYRLHDHRYNAEAWTVILMEGLARDVDELGRQARAGQPLDLAAYEKESRQWLQPMSAETYALLPSAASLPGAGWRLARYHPLLAEKAALRWEESILIRNAGLLDERPAVFTGIRDFEDMDVLTKLLKDPDPFFSGAARRALEALAAGAGNPELKGAAVDALSRENSRFPMPAAVLAAGALRLAIENPRLSRRRLLGLRD